MHCANYFLPMVLAAADTASYTSTCRWAGARWKTDAFGVDTIALLCRCVFVGKQMTQVQAAAAAQQLNSAAAIGV